MMSDSTGTLALTAVLALGTALPVAAVTATETVGLGGYDDGWATRIDYYLDAARGDANDRDNPENALGPTDGEFFEISWGSSVILTFSTLFSGAGFVTEVTFGDPADWVEGVAIFAGMYGEDPTTWDPVTPLQIFNTDTPDGEGRRWFDVGDGTYDALRITDLGSAPQGDPPAVSTSTACALQRSRCLRAACCCSARSADWPHCAANGDDP